jgi:hypothetical protein
VDYRLLFGKSEEQVPLVFSSAPKPRAAVPTHELTCGSVWTSPYCCLLLRTFRCIMCTDKR